MLPPARPAARSRSLLLGAAAALCLLPFAAAANVAQLPAIPKSKETPRGKAVVLVVPFANGEEVPDWAGYGFAELVTDLFAQANLGSWLTSKQLDAVLRRKDLQLYDASDLEVALPVSRSLGATDLITGELRREGGRYSVTAHRVVLSQRGMSRAVTLAGPDLTALAEQVADQLLDAKPKQGAMTHSAKALELASRCWLELVRYPMQPRIGNTAPLGRADLVEATCKGAIDADAQFGWARAGLAVVHALRDKAAEGRAEAKESQKGRFNAYGYAAESFCSRRAGDQPAAMAALEWGIKERPGFLLAIGYLAEDRMEAEDFKGAVASWDRYLKRAPRHPFALGQKGKALGYLGRHKEAIALSRQALDLDPNDPELQVELASRLIDAQQDQEAEAVLRQAMEARPPRPLAWLRLGYLYLRQKRAQDAHDVLVEAVTYAYREDEGRTRGLAFADLALVAAMQGKYRETVEYLTASKAEGNKSLPCSAQELKPFAGKAELAAVCGVPK